MTEDPRFVAASKVQPFGKYCVVLPLVPENVSEGGLHLVAAGDEMPAKAHVITAGPKCESAVEGMLVLIKKYQGMLYEIDKEEVLLIHEDALVGQVIDYIDESEPEDV